MAVLLVLALFVPPVAACASPPVDGPVVAGFAPGNGFGGHWGVDYLVPVGTPVRAVFGGTVTFAGLVVDNLSVTVNHGGGLRTSYSFLDAIDVVAGQTVSARQAIGASGLAHGTASLHLSLRRGDRYLDPVGLFRCAEGPGRALRLISTGRRPLYAVRRAARNPGRNLRSTSCGPSHGRGSRPPPARPRRHYLHHRR
ncbi:MAG: M23 family metallopeptidase [Acidimicrobiia bacterium]|nr:M23 family metallopeptidase [Acidimicrobiia bacterium]